jgi:geranylgeranyl reductase family protein
MLSDDIGICGGRIMRYDVAVVGAGPAGATVARFLSKSGLTVALVEKEELPRDKPCGGALSIHHLKRFKYLDGKGDELGCPSYGVKIYSNSLVRAGTTYSDPQLLMVLRDKFDKALVDMAQDYGAELKHNWVKDVSVTQDGANLVLDGGKVLKSRLVVGADGVNSVVAKKTGLNSGWSKWQVAINALEEIYVGESVIENYIGSQRPLHIFMLNNLFGYGWLFSKKEHFNIGVGGLSAKTKNISDVFFGFVRLLKKMKLIPKDLQNSKFKAHLVPTSGVLNKVFGDRVVLCGDAAGTSSPLNGEGVYYAMVSGQIASSLILKALEEGNVMSSGLKGYQKELMEDFGFDHEVALNLQRQALSTWPLMGYAVDLVRSDERLLRTSIDYGLGKISSDQFLLESGLRLPFSSLLSAVRALLG